MDRSCAHAPSCDAPHAMLLYTGHQLWGYEAQNQRIRFGQPWYWLCCRVLAGIPNCCIIAECRGGEAVHVSVSILPAAARGHPACGAPGRLTGRMQVSKILLSLLHLLSVPDLTPALRKAQCLAPCTRRASSPIPCSMSCVAAAHLDSQKY